MTYKRKFTAFSGIIAVLAVIYILTIIFDPERRGTRSDSYSWLEPSQTARISGIAIVNNGETINLVRNGGKWFVSSDGKDYPARTARAEDFIAALTKRAPYPVRSTSASSYERFLITDDQAVRVTVTAGAGQPLLTLFLGGPDTTGQNIYMRKQGQNEVRSGEDIFSVYTHNSTLQSWYDLRLFPETETGGLDAASVQRLTAYPPPDGEKPSASYMFSRNGREWDFNFELDNPDMGKADNYIRDILNTSGDDFAYSVSSSDPLFNNSRIVLELGDGSTRTIRLSPPDENGGCFAVVSGSDWVYSIPAWMSQRLFADPKTFEAD